MVDFVLWSIKGDTDVALPPLGLTDGERAELQRRVRAQRPHNATSLARG